MKKLLFATLVLTGLTAVLMPTASAQMMPSMDLSWGLRAQAQYQQIGAYNARVAAMTYYNYMLRLRQMGYTGPSLPTGVTPQSLQASIQRSQQAANAFMQSGAHSTDVRSNAAGNWDWAALRGCHPYYVNGGTYLDCTR